MADFSQKPTGNVQGGPNMPSEDTEDTKNGGKDETTPQDRLNQTGSQNTPKK